MGPYGVALRAAAPVLVLGLVAGCSSDASSWPREAPLVVETTELTSTATPTPTPSAAATSATPTATTPPASEPVPAFSTVRAMRTVRVLAEDIGPRLATGPAFGRATRYVAGWFAAAGYDVRRQRFAVPAGDSWGVPVRAGTSLNLVVTPVGFDPRAPYLLVGAHLDTVAVAPGAEDNASGIAVLLETARRAAATPPRLPTVFVAFGAEEPRGPGDDMHHFGSLHYVDTMTAPERRNLQAMVALDRVGVGTVVPVSSAPDGPVRVRAALAAGARVQGIGTTLDVDTASDHWSFALAGYPVARLGSTPYAGYHSAQDVAAVVDPAQLGRTGRVIWAWLRGR
jgi:aminopeptidase YwaD